MRLYDALNSTQAPQAFELDARQLIAPLPGSPQHNRGEAPKDPHRQIKWSGLLLSRTTFARGQAAQ